MAEPILLNSRQMAGFAARGFLRFDGIVPAAVNRAFMDRVEIAGPRDAEGLRRHYGRMMASEILPSVPAGTPLETAYPEGSPLRDLLRLPRIAGAVASLVGPDCLLDHHFVHVTYPPGFHAAAGRDAAAQHYHQDSTIDPRRAFDVQLLYFPQAVTPDMGGTRFLPGSHLRVVSEMAIARYQNIAGQQHVVCPAGTVLLLHHGIWHGGGMNRSERLRYLVKLRLGPIRRQCRLWDTSDLPARRLPQRPIFWTGVRRGAQAEGESIDAILTRPEPWFEADSGRLEYINRIRFWRQLTGDPHYDADYWLSRIENEPTGSDTAERG